MELILLTGIGYYRAPVRIQYKKSDLHSTAQYQPSMLYSYTTHYACRDNKE